MMQTTYDNLIKAAHDAFENAYAPYSKFHVGAAIITKNGEVFTGANVENASYGLTNCAERSALYTAYSKGYRKEDFEAIAIIADCDRPISPCGACRQVMSELLPANTPVILTNLSGEVKHVTIDVLLPYTFTSEDI